MTDPEPPDLEALVDRLTDAHDLELADTEQHVTIRRQPPLLGALADARTASVGIGRGNSKGLHERLTLNVDASDLQTSIEHAVREWVTRAGYRPAAHRWPPLDRLLRFWWHTVAEDPDLDRRRYARKLAGWVEAIEDLIDPPRRYTLEQPCPECGVAYVETAEQHGRALQVTARPTAEHSAVTCRSCGHVWRGVTGAKQLAARIYPEEKTA